MSYTADKIVGKGTFGTVYKARDGDTGEIVAVKKVLQDRRYKNRELSMMKELSHQNVIRMRKAFYTTS
jgi:serine/threonine protein kinase